MKNCASCHFFNNNPAWLEKEFPGLNILSSAYASVRADAGVCHLKGIFLPPWKTCEDFKPV